MTLKALVVSADPEASTVLSRTLNGLGVSTDCSPEPSVAAQTMAHERFDAMVLDWSEDEACAHLIAAARSTPRSKRLLVVAVVSGTDQLQRVFDAGTNLVMYKPLSADRARASLRGGL